VVRTESQQAGTGLTTMAGATKNDHHLILEKFTPESLVALRSELAEPHNSDIFNRAIKEPTFEGALATIAECLDIVLDGMYDVPDLCAVLAAAMRQRHSHGSQPHLRDQRLRNVEMVEREGTVVLEEVADGIVTVAPDCSGGRGVESLNVTEEEFSNEE
jgi:hypothetical protein